MEPKPTKSKKTKNKPGVHIVLNVGALKAWLSSPPPAEDSASPNRESDTPPSFFKRRKSFRIG